MFESLLEHCKSSSLLSSPVQLWSPLRHWIISYLGGMAKA